MYSIQELKKQNLSIMMNNGVELWDGYDDAISEYANSLNVLQTELDDDQILTALLENGVSEWKNYEHSMNEYEMYEHYISEELGLVSFEEYISSHNLTSKGNDDLADIEGQLLEHNVKAEVKMGSIMKSTELTTIASVIKKIKPALNDFEVASMTNDFNDNAEFYSPTSRLGLELLYQAKQITANTVFAGIQMTANEYLLVARPIYLGLSVHSGHLETEIKEFFNI